MPMPDDLDLPVQPLDDRRRQGDDAVLVSLALADDDLSAIEVDVLNPEPATFEQPQPRPLHQLGHEPVDAFDAA